MIFKFALKNIRHTIDQMPTFILSVGFSIMVAFSFFQISMNSDFANKIVHDVSIGSYNSIQQQLIVVLISIHYFIIFFIFLFILYSNNFFMKQRKQDISTLLLTGFSKFQIASYFMTQIFVVGLVSVFSGIALGLIFTRLIFMFLLKLMSVDSAPTIPFNPNSIYEILAFFILAMVVLFLNTIYHISKTKASFVVGKNHRKKLMTERAIIQVPLGILSLIILFANFFWWLVWLPNEHFGQSNFDDAITQGIRSDLSFVLAVMGVFACFGLFKWSIPMIVNFVKRLRLPNDVQLIWLNYLKKALQQNSLVLTIITITSIIAVAIFSALTFAYPYRQQELMVNSPTKLAVSKSLASTVLKIAEKNNVHIQLADSVTVRVLSAPISKDETSGYNYFSFVSLRDYNEFTKRVFRLSPVRLYGREAILLTDTRSSAGNSAQVDEFVKKGVARLPFGTFTINDTSKYFPLGSYMYIGNVFVLSDREFSKVNSDFTYQLQDYKVKDSRSVSFQDAIRHLTDDEDNTGMTYFGHDKNGKLLINSKYFTDFEEAKMEINYQDPGNSQFKQVIGLAVFILLFLGVLLILASNNLLLLKLQDSTFDNIRDFRLYRRMGGTKADLRRIIFGQTSVFFFAPVAVTIIANIGFLRIMVLEFQVGEYWLAVVVLFIYGILNIIFYYLAYRHFNTMIYTSVLERK